MKDLEIYELATWCDNNLCPSDGYPKMLEGENQQRLERCLLDDFGWGKAWEAELSEKIKMDSELDEKHAGGVYDMALDMTEQITRIFFEHNTLNSIGDAYFPETEIAGYIYDAIKYGDVKS